MQISRQLQLGATLTALILAGCSSSPVSRIDANRAAYESWPLDIQQAVLNGEAQKGMTPDQVEMAKGKPSKVEDRGSGDQIWTYGSGESKSSSLLRNTGISVGGGMGGVGVGVGHSLGGRRGAGTGNGNDEQEVVFSNGVVTRVD